jgi:hypothetical protein
VSGSDIVRALTPVVDELERLDVVYYVGGSVASSTYGVARSTLDVDLVASLRVEHVAPFTGALAPAYYLDVGRVRSAVESRRSFNLIHLETMIKVDVFVSKTRAYDRQVGDRVRRQTLQSDPAARSFFFAAPEDVVLAKLEWYRAGGQVSERQWSDILGVLKAQGAALDTEYMRRWATVLGVVDLLSKALDEAGP